MKFLKFILLFTLVISFNTSATGLSVKDGKVEDKSICRGNNLKRLLKGGRLLETESHLRLDLQKLQKSFLISKNSIIHKNKYPVILANNYIREFFPEEGEGSSIISYKVEGKEAAIIYFYLLDYYKTNEHKPCQVIDYAGGVVYGNGVTCMWSDSNKLDEGFTCSFLKYDSGETSNDFLNLPRPRMGSGNAASLQEDLLVDLHENDWVIELNSPLYVLPLNSDTLFFN
jgi:hypothetical protein